MSAPQPRTILYAAWAPFFSGAERALLVLLENLDRSQYRPVAAVGTDAELASELRSRGIRVVHVPVVYSDVRHLPSWSVSVGRLAWLAWRERAALVHSNDLPSFQPAGYAARTAGIPAVTHVRFPDGKSGFEWFLKPGFSRAIFVSASAREEALAEAPDLFRDRSEVIYDGVHVPPVPDDVERTRLRDELGLPRDRTIVVLAGQVAEVKGIWEYLDAAGMLVERGVPAFFVVLGDDLKNKGALRIQAEQAVKARGLADCVKFLGFRPSAFRLMPAFDIVAAPSHVEPLGLMALEGMASARPVVASRVGGLAETVVDGVTGSLVPSRDSAGLANAVEAFVRDPAKARAFGLAGRQRVLERFSVAAHVSAMHAFYDRALGVGARTEALENRAAS